MSIKTKLIFSVLTMTFVLPFQATAADVDKCFKNAVKSEAKGLNALNQALAQDCKAGVKFAEDKITLDQFSSIHGKITDKLIKKFEKLKAKNDKLVDRLDCESIETAAFSGSMHSTLPGGAYGGNQLGIPDKVTLGNYLISSGVNECIEAAGGVLP